MDVAIDTSVLLGLLDPHDVWHPRAVGLQADLQARGFTGVYFDCVIGETVSIATRRLCEKKRVEEFDPLLDRMVANFPLTAITWIGADVPALHSDILALVRVSKVS